MRRELLRSLGEFAGGAGHELNNPLAVILGRAQLLLGRTTDPEAQRSLRAIIGQAQRAHRILRDLMYVARPSAPRPRLCQPVELGRLVLRDLADEAEGRGVGLSFEAGDDAGPAWTDPEALRHLVEVLTRNAIEATPPGGTVHVATRRERGHWVWQFRDPGRGLGPEAVRHLLDPFYCGRAAGRGLGLGLPRVARYIDSLGGGLHWKANPEGGTTFLVAFPIVEPPGEATAAGEPGTERNRDELPAPTHRELSWGPVEASMNRDVSGDLSDRIGRIQAIPAQTIESAISWQSLQRYVIFKGSE